MAVVVPAYNEERLIGQTIDSVPDFVDSIVVVNDRSTDRTEQIVRDHVARDEGRVVLINLPENEGVGGAIAAGYLWAREHKIDCTAVMAGDGQMDPGDLPALLDPVVDGKADYTKGNRLFYGDAWNMIPKIRYLGNSALSLMTKIASGYWHVADSQTGYTVASLKDLETIGIEQIYKRYGMPNDVLVKLNVYDFIVQDISVKPVYNIGEVSGINILKILFTIPLLLARLFIYRMTHKYIIRDFHPLVLFYAFGFSLLALDAALFIRLLSVWYQTQSIPPINALANVFLTFMGFQSLLFAMLFDMEANKHLKGQ